MQTDDGLALLELGGEQFAAVLARVPDDAWDRPTGCDDWDVRALVGHVVGGQRLATIILHGAGRDEALGALAADLLGDDPGAAFAREHAACVEAFREPGALECTVAHPMGDIPATMLLGFRIGDLTLHAWDLAHATGTDEALAPALVEAVWASVYPMGESIAQTGVFGDGPSGTVPDDAPLQLRLLDFTGRRP